MHLIFAPGEQGVICLYFILQMTDQSNASNCQQNAIRTVSSGLSGPTSFDFSFSSFLSKHEIETYRKNHNKSTMKTAHHTSTKPSVASKGFLFFLAALGTAAFSFFLIGSTKRIPVTVDDGRELLPQQQNDALYSPFMIDQHVMSMIQELEHMHDRHEAQFFNNLRSPSSFLSQPRFDVQEDDESVTVKVDVPKDVPLEEIQVEIRSGSILHIQGGHEDNHSSIRFEKTFALGRHLNPDSITAKLSKSTGELIVTAPKEVKKEKEVRKIDVIKTEL